MLLLDLFEARQTTNEKLWVNPSAKKIITVPKRYHHTQMVYLKPEKFGLPKDLFANHKYPMMSDWMEMPSEYTPFDPDVGKAMFDRGWVRVNVDENIIRLKPLIVEGLHADLHGNDLKVIAKALGYLTRNNYDIRSIIIEKGNDIMATSEYIISEPKRIKLFMRNGVIPRKRIAETVGENLLYHGTLTYQATKILQVKALTRARLSHRTMKISPRDLKASKRNELAFSMTRDPNLNYAVHKKGLAEIVFVFRRDVLANNFTIIPFDFAGTHPKQAYTVFPKEESEEQVIGKRIPVDSKTVAKIIIRSIAYGDDGNGGGTGGDLNLLREMAKEANIPIVEEQ